MFMAVISKHIYLEESDEGREMGKKAGGAAESLEKPPLLLWTPG